MRRNAYRTHWCYISGLSQVRSHNAGTVHVSEHSGKDFGSDCQELKAFVVEIVDVMDHNHSLCSYPGQGLCEQLAPTLRVTG